MVAHKKALQSLWKGTCKVTGKEQKQNPVTKRTEFADAVLFENLPCRLSFESAKSADFGGVSSGVHQSIKLFLDNEVRIPVGSTIEVTQNGVTTAYKQSGQPAAYSCHQEIMLELAEDKA